MWLAWSGYAYYYVFVYAYLFMQVWYIYIYIHMQATWTERWSFHNIWSLFFVVASLSFFSMNVWWTFYQRFCIIGSICSAFVFVIFYMCEQETWYWIPHIDRFLYAISFRLTRMESIWLPSNSWNVKCLNFYSCGTFSSERHWLIWIFDVGQLIRQRK